MKKFLLIFTLLVSVVLTGCSVTIKQETGSVSVHSNLMTDSTSSQADDSTTTSSVASDESEQESSQISASSRHVTSSKKSASADSTSTVPKAPDNFILYDDISGKVILSCYVEMTETTVGKLTLQVLQQNKLPYEKMGSGKGIYFKSMVGLSESTKDGKMTGWCFYVKKAGQADFIKPSTGSGRYAVTTGDVIKWMYVKDGAGLE